MRMIDADGHVVEQLQLPDDVAMAFSTQLQGEVPPAVDDPAPNEASHAELMFRPGGSQPGPRLKDMDAEGIDAAVLYPTTPGLAWVPNPEVFHAMAHVYNDWLHAYCSEDSSRLFGVGRSLSGSAVGCQGDGALRQ